MKYPSYTYPVDKLCAGSSLGNYYCFVRFDAETNTQGFWCADVDQFYLGEWTTAIRVDGVLLKPGTTEFFPESQCTLFSDGAVSVSKRAFIPFFLEGEADFHIGEMHSLIYMFQVRNESSATRKINLRHRLQFSAQPSPLFTKQPPTHEMGKRYRIKRRGCTWEIITEKVESEARIIVSPTDWTASDVTGDCLSLEYEWDFPGGGVREISFAMVISARGVEEARHLAQDLGDHGVLHVQSVENYKKLLLRSEVITPDEVINRGFQWAKVNTVRVQHRYRIGEAFTNDPPQDIVVVRDVAWYILGADYLTPLFSRNVLSLAGRFATHEGGKLTEYIHANDSQPEKNDYRLNINDDTPLFVYALYHHAITGRDEKLWKTYYPMMRDASEWIISQIRDGLVRCFSTGVQVWGICSWRNMIDDYTLSGAVTEVNAECYQALRCTAEIATRLGLTADAHRYSSRAEFLKGQINSQLISPKTSLYLLNLDSHGRPHDDITGDLVFPVMFGVADDLLKKRILKILAADEFWTRFGSRTVSRKDKSYDPELGFQLMGGVWHNLTAWTAYCLGRDNPTLLVEGMRNIYRLSEIENPRNYGNVVPGQFPERLHGESFLSRGMALSPWMPPTYVWLGIEGLLGVRPTWEALELSPCVPTSWKWIVVKNLPIHGRCLTAFLFGGALYSNIPVTSYFPVTVGSLLPARCENDAISAVCLQVEHEILLFACSGETTEGVIHIQCEGRTIDRRVSLDANEGVLLRLPFSGSGHSSQGEQG